MAIIYDFFKSVDGDRALSADRFANRFRSFISDGVIVQDDTLLTDELEVTANDTDLEISIETGKAIVQGYFVELTATETLTLIGGDATNDRIDRIILEVNINDSQRKVILKVLEGTAAAIPIAPSLTQDLEVSFIYQISIAQILVPATATLILDSNVTDERDVANLNLKINPATGTDADGIGFDDSGETYISGANVQAALESVDDELVNLNGYVAIIIDAVSILSTGWTDDTGTSGYYYYEHSNANITANDVVDVNFALTSLDDAADVLGITESYTGKVRIYATAEPTEDLTADIKIIKGSVV